MSVYDTLNCDNWYIFDLMIINAFYMNVNTSLVDNVDIFLLFAG